MATPREERLARNEASFRELNESLETKVHAKLLSPQSNLVGFVCECGDAECVATVRMPIPRYEEIRRDSRLFFVCPGHEMPEIEDVFDREEGFVVVRKHDEVAHVVESTDPRD